MARIIEDINKLSHSQLIEAMVFTFAPVDGNAKQVNDIRSYYNLLSYEQLLEKARGHQLLMEDESYKVTSADLKRREAQMNRPIKRPATQARSISSSNFITSHMNIPASRSAQEKLIDDLMFRAWVTDAVEVCPGVVGVKLDQSYPIEKCMKKVKKIKDEIGFTGDIIYG